MNQTAPNAAIPLAALRRLAGTAVAPAEICDFCSIPVSPEHRHLLELSSRRIQCVCDPCGLRFEGVVGGRFKLIPRDALELIDFRLADEQWSNFALPINLAFFFTNSQKDEVGAMYPSPAGAMESLLNFKDWGRLVSDNPALNEMEPDTMALLVNRVGEARDYFLAPMDVCLGLSGLVRKYWRGFSGGEEVWREIDGFFQSLRRRARPLSNETAYARS